jgi:copper chaperone CopZ
VLNKISKPIIMKIYLSFLLLSIFILSCNRVNTTTEENISESKEQQTENIKTVKLDVSGMTCEGCENTIESALTKVDGVVNVEASYVNAVANISYDSTKVEEHSLAQAINETGYKVIEPKTVGVK